MYVILVALLVLLGACVLAILAGRQRRPTVAAVMAD
jgi:hypothetical protein